MRHYVGLDASVKRTAVCVIDEAGTVILERSIVAHPGDIGACLKAVPGGTLAKRAAMMVGRYIHAKQFRRAGRELKFLRTRLRRMPGIELPAVLVLALPADL